MIKISPTSKFRKDYKKIQKRGYNIKLLENVVKILAEAKTLPEKYLPHPLQGDYKGYMECHILPDWLLIYKIKDDELVLVLSRTGTHSDLF